MPRLDGGANADGFASKSPGPGPSCGAGRPKRFERLPNDAERFTRLLGESGFVRSLYDPGPGVSSVLLANRWPLLEKAAEGALDGANEEGTGASSSLRGVSDPCSAPRGTSTGVPVRCQGMSRALELLNDGLRDDCARALAEAAIPKISSGLYIPGTGPAIAAGLRPNRDERELNAADMD